MPVIPILRNESFPGLRELTTRRPDTGPNLREPVLSKQFITAYCSVGFLLIPAECSSPGRFPVTGWRFSGEQHFPFLSNGFFHPPRFCRHSGTSTPQNISLKMRFRIYQQGWDRQTDPQTVGLHGSLFHSPIMAQKEMHHFLKCHFQSALVVYVDK